MVVKTGGEKKKKKKRGTRVWECPGISSIV